MRFAPLLILVSVLASNPAWAEDTPSSEPAPVTGTWHLLTEFRGREMISSLTIERAADGSLSGTYVDSSGRSSAVEKLTYESGILKFTRAAGRRTMTFQGSVEAGVLTGHHLGGRMRIPATGHLDKQAFDALVAARRKANERSDDLEGDYDKHARRGAARDAFPVLFDPPMKAAAEAEGILDDEPVIGISIGAEAKAYPIAIMGVHELVNDTCGGRSIAASW